MKRTPLTRGPSMHRRFYRSLPAALLVLAACAGAEVAAVDSAAPTAPPAEEAALWEGQSSGLRIRWTPSDLRVVGSAGDQ